MSREGKNNVYMYLCLWPRLQCTKGERTASGQPLPSCNESTEVHNPRRDCAILTLAHKTHQTDVPSTV